MRRPWIVRLLGLWIAFGLGSLAGAWIAGGHAHGCQTSLIEVNTDDVENAVEAALPVAATGSGTVSLTLDLTGMHVHADSTLANQSYDRTIAAVVRGAPVTVEVSSSVLTQLLSH